MKKRQPSPKKQRQSKFEVYLSKVMQELENKMLWQRVVQQTYPKVSIAARDVIEAGRQAWERIKKSRPQRQNWRDWQQLSDAMEVGEAMAKQIAGKAEGGAYARSMQAWLKLNGMDDIATSTRAWMREVRKHQTEIDAWRNSLLPEQKMKMNHPRTILEYWKRIPEAHRPRVVTPLAEMWRLEIRPRAEAQQTTANKPEASQQSKPTEPRRK